MRVFLVLFYFFAAVLSVKGADDHLGVVTFCKGDATLIRDSETRSLQIDDVLDAQDILKTGKKAKIRIILKLPEGSKSKAIGPDSRVSVSDLVAGASKGKTNLGTVAKEMIGFLVDTKKVKTAGVAVIRGNKAMEQHLKKVPIGFVLSHGRSLASISILTASPNLEFDEFRFSLFDRKKTLLFSGISTSPIALLPASLKLPGNPLTVEVGFRKNGETLQEEKEDFWLLSGKASTDLKATLEAVETSISDDEDPTVHLILGEGYFSHGCFFESANAFAEYCRKVPQSELGKGMLKKALARLGWQNPSNQDLELFLNSTPVPLEEKSELILLDE